MPRRLKFIVAYDGAPFAGWQSQSGGNTVQNHLERAFAAIAGGELRVHGAGRTDAGVHALAQCAHVDLPDRSLSPAQWPLALNTHLPPTVRVLRAAYVGQAFHARFSAVGKIYRYRIWNDRILPPFELGRAWQVNIPIDASKLSAAAKLFVGTHNFAAYCANRGHPERSTTRTIHSVRAKCHHALIEIDVSGNGFLYKMVRMIVGELVRCATGRSSEAQVAARIRAGASQRGGPRLVAAAGGLYLLRVRY